MGITVYGCEPDEAVLFRRIGPRYGINPTLVAAAVPSAGGERPPDHRSISVGHKTPIADSVLRALSRNGVRYISTRSIGYNHIDVAYAASVGITVENVAYSPDSVADYTVMLMLMVLRHTKTTIRRAQVHDYRLNDVRGRELRDLTVGVVGTGRIGAAVVDRLRGFGARILAHDRCPGTAAEYRPLDALLEQSDLVTLHTPLTRDTRHLLDRSRIDRMRAGALVVNTARGGLIDTAALLGALEGGRLGGAALDVLEGEEGVFYSDRRGRPVTNAHLVRLQAPPNVLITPHTAYYTDHALSDIVENTLVNCRRFERGRAWTA